MKNLSLIAAVVLVSSVASWGNGYAITAQSVRSYALNNSYIAYTDGADTAYFNPANMVWLDEGSKMELGASYINSTDTKFVGTVGGMVASANSKADKTALPFIHYVSPKFEKWRFGLSVVEPAGIAKRWNSPIQMITAEETYLGVIELNPSLAYEFNSQLALGLGIRIQYAMAEFKAQLPSGMHPVLTQGYRQDMDGDDVAVGFNIALTYKPTDSLSLAAVYRTEIELDIEGEGSGYTTNPLSGFAYPFEGAHGSVTLHTPAVLTLAASKEYDKMILNFVYERMFWSVNKELDLDFYDFLIEGTLGQTRPQKWKDNNSYRFGASYQYNNELKLMGGISFEETPIPARTLGFDLPDADLWWMSAGFTYKFNPDMEFGLAYSYGKYDERTIELSDANVNSIVGEFSDTSFHTLTASLTYNF